MHLIFLRTASPYLCRCRFPLLFSRVRKMNHGNSSVPPQGIDFPTTLGSEASNEKKAQSNSQGHGCTPTLQNPYNQKTLFSDSQPSNKCHQRITNIAIEQPEPKPVSMLTYKTDLDLLSEESTSTSPKNMKKNLHTMRTKINTNSTDRLYDASSVQIENFSIESSIDGEASSLPTHFGEKQLGPYRKKPKNAKVYANKATKIENFCSNKGSPVLEPFDICQSSVQTKLPWLLKSEDNHHQVEHSSESIRQILRPGMVLLKSYIKLSEQIDIVKQCRDLGLGPGGFYQPSFRYGAKLCLQMMCLGLNWDLETRKYEEVRPFDGSKPPGIPHAFSSLVEQAIQDSHALITEKQSLDKAENILPSMTPNICIVNFYSMNGRLGLHQDRDESMESLRKGLPVVSFSMGDSAEFLYGNQRDVNKAEKVLLESGDILIFGGESRHIFHGVTSIIPDSAPMALSQDSKLRPGRLNLTFRQY